MLCDFIQSQKIMITKITGIIKLPYHMHCALGTVIKEIIKNVKINIHRD